VLLKRLSQSFFLNTVRVRQQLSESAVQAVIHCFQAVGPRLEGFFVYLLVESESESDLHAVVTCSRRNWKFCDIISAIV